MFNLSPGAAPCAGRFFLQMAISRHPYAKKTRGWISSIVSLHHKNSSIYWNVGSSATLDTSTVFAGNILADQSITLNTTAKILCGRAIALNAAITMDTNTISNDCTGGGDLGTERNDFGSIGFSGGSNVASVPEPAAFLLLGSGLAGLFGFRKKSSAAA